MINNRNNIKKLFRDLSSNSPAKMSKLIDGLWRDPLFLYNEQKLSVYDRNKADLTHLDYNPLYVYAASSFREADGTQAASYATANGFGHKVRADFAQVHGYGNEAFSFFETIMGPHGTIAANQTPDEWIPTDRLFTIANGPDPLNRSDALNVYKSGYAEFHNAIVPGAYNHSADGITQETPLPGSFQYTEAAGFEGYHNGAWINFAAAADMHNPVTIADDGSQLVLSLTDQELSIDLSNYAEYADIVDTFIELYDTPNTYDNFHQHGLIVSSDYDRVVYSSIFGSHPDYFWIKRSCPDVQSYEDIIINGTFDIDLSGWTSTGWTYNAGTALHTPGNVSPLQQYWSPFAVNNKKLIFEISGLTAGSITVTLTGSPETATISTNGTHTVYFSSDYRPYAYLDFVPTSDFDGAIDNVQLIPQSEGSAGNAQIVGFDSSDREIAYQVRWSGNSLYVGNGAGAEAIANDNVTPNYGALNNAVFAPYGAANIVYGSDNTIIGHSAGNGIVNSNGSTLIGYGANNPADVDNYVNLADVLYGLPSDMNFAGNITLNKGEASEIRFPASGAVTGGLMQITVSHQLDYIYPYIDHLLTLGSAGQMPVVVDTEGVKSIAWADAPGGLPDGTNGDIIYYNNGWKTLSATISRKVLTSINGMPSWQSPVWTIDTAGAHNNNHIGIGVDSSSSNRLIVIETGEYDSAIYAKSTSGMGLVAVSDYAQAARFLATDDYNSASSLPAVIIENERNSEGLIISQGAQGAAICATSSLGDIFWLQNNGDLEFRGGLFNITGSTPNRDEYLIAHLLNSGVQAATAGQVPTIVDTEGVKSIAWADAPDGLSEITKAMVEAVLTGEITSHTHPDSGGDSGFEEVQIGDQIWMAKNLDVDDGQGGISAYNNDESNVATYGRLYSVEAAQRIADSIEGWRLATDEDWTIMENYLADNGYNYDGTIGGGRAKIAKALATDYGWNTSGVVGSVGKNDYPEYRNKSGFSGLPGGLVLPSPWGIFQDSYYWTNTEANSSEYYYRRIWYKGTDVQRGSIDKTYGASIRLIKDTRKPILEITKAMVENVLIGEISSHFHAIPGTETLSGTSITIEWNRKTTATITLTGSTAISFGSPANYVKRLFVSGNYPFSIPASSKIVSGNYIGSTINVIDLVPQPDGTVWVQINQEES